MIYSRVQFISSFKPGLVFVIMPCFNAELFVREAVDSVFTRTYRDVELIVVDDGSSDKSWQILQRLGRKYNGKIHLLQQEKPGPYPARNLALSKASGEFFMFLDADNYWSTIAWKNSINN